MALDFNPITKSPHQFENRGYGIGQCERHVEIGQVCEYLKLRSLSTELGKEGITVNCICPGPINTAMTERIPEADKATYARRRPSLRRYGDPEEVAHATMSLVLPAASFITGVALPVDGGLTIRRA